MPGSPGSSNTSLSVAASPQNKVPTTPGISGEESSTEIPLAQDNDQPSAPVPPPVMKTWASLLRSDGSSNSKQTPNTLPVSSVVGFSIPGGLESSQPTLLPLRGKKQDILVLLTSGPAGPGQVPKIVPRGLVNSGNMCFANAVLQILVYCQPFYRLLTELGKFLPNPDAGSFLKKAEDKTPLLHSAIQFLKEFDPPDKDKRRREEDEDEEMLNSFTPTCIYDAMKEKKRFDNMRVSLSMINCERLAKFYLPRVAIKRMQRSS
jgi:ubiquitin carboxyl-terminal hydrolase 10